MDNPTLAQILELYQKQLEFFGKRLAGGADQSVQKQKQDVHWMQVHFTRAESYVTNTGINWNVWRS